MGFKHDEQVPGINYEKFDLLREETAPQDQKPWWKVWK